VGERGRGEKETDEKGEERGGQGRGSGTPTFWENVTPPTPRSETLVLHGPLAGHSSNS